MSPDQIQKLLSLGEGQRVEFKSSIKNVDALGRIICGLLNTSGGYLSHIFNPILRGTMKLPEVVSRIKRHASQTGFSYLGAAEF